MIAAEYALTSLSCILLRVLGSPYRFETAPHLRTLLPPLYTGFVGTPSYNRTVSYIFLMSEERRLKGLSRTVTVRWGETTVRLNRFHQAAMNMSSRVCVFVVEPVNLY